MPLQPSLNPIDPVRIPHGTEISIVLNGVTIGEIYELSYDSDQHIEAINQLGSRIIGRRPGQYEISGTVKSYWVSGPLRQAAIAGQLPTNNAGIGSSIYNSKAPFNRYDIQVVSTNPNAPSAVLKNVVFEKDTVTWTSNAVTQESITFVAEELYSA